MTVLRVSWLVLAALAAGWSLFLGVPIWLTAAALTCAILPSLIGFFLSGSAPRRQTIELETVFWIVVATAGASLTGGALSPLNLGYAIPVMLALGARDSRLTAEAGAFAMAGFALSAMLAGGFTTDTIGASVLTPEYARMLASAFAACLLAQTGLVAAIAVAGGLAPPERRRSERVAPPPPAAPGNGDLERRLRAAESRAIQAEGKLSASQAELKDTRHRFELRTRFFAQVSHELRTPLNAILGFAEMLKSGVFGQLADKQQEYAELIHEGGRNLSLVVDDVLDLSRVEAGRFEIAPELVSLTDLAAEAVRFMADMAARKNVELVLMDDDAEAFADSRAVRQIALNLISNALKFTPEGGEVTVSTIETASGAVLAVSDTGAGISPEELRRLSLAFEQGEEGKRHKGAGLGLSVVRAFAELHGGRLDIESRQGGGSTVAVFFPAEPTGGM